MDALPMSDEEITFFKSIAGGRNPPKRPVRELWAACARRTGEDSVASGIGAYSAAFFDQHHRLRPDERAVILCVACDQNQAKIVLNYIRSYFSDIPMLRAMVRRETKSGFELNNFVDITVASNDYRSSRGRPVRLAIFDEVGFFRDENSASPDTEL
jgi:phage terminase large subunit-like protein